MASDPVSRLRASLSRPASQSSDYDLNPGLVLPENRVLRPAAVLVGIATYGQAGPQLVLTKRASHLRNHPGQIAFPGGRKDEGDAKILWPPPCAKPKKKSACPLRQWKFWAPCHRMKLSQGIRSRPFWA
jgi:hypothetical protein